MFIPEVPSLGLSGSQPEVRSAAKSAAAEQKELFLNLLVTQMKNQDPLNPQDATQFVQQLTQFSQLEQLIAIRESLG